MKTVKNSVTIDLQTPHWPKGCIAWELAIQKPNNTNMDSCDKHLTPSKSAYFRFLDFCGALISWYIFIIKQKKAQKKKTQNHGTYVEFTSCTRYPKNLTKKAPLSHVFKLNWKLKNRNIMIFPLFMKVSPVQNT